MLRQLRFLSSYPWLEKKGVALFLENGERRRKLLGSGFPETLIADISECEKRVAQLHKDLTDKSLRDLTEIIRSDIEEQTEIIESKSGNLRKLIILEMEKNTNFFHQDQLDARIEVRPGVGGDEALKWAQEVFNMYVNVAVQVGWEIAEEEEQESCFKCIIRGNSSLLGAPYRMLRFESGVHRVQRVPFNSDRMQTSAAAVYVIPKVEVPKIQIRESDLKIFISKKSSGAGGQSVNSAYQQVRMTHVPSGFTVVVNESHAQQENREIALEKIQKKVQQMEEEKVLAAMASCRKGQVRTADRSEKVRSYNFQRNEVNDHRVLGMTMKESCESFMKDGSSLITLWTALRDQTDNQLINDFLLSDSF